jgi:nicotinamidase/pyrazinamidase
MNTIRIDVDTQNGFCSADGHLYVPADEQVQTNIRALVADSVQQRIPIVGSVDSHAYDAWEFQDNGGPFPAHCVKGTRDWLKIDGTLPDRFRFIPMSEGHLVVGEATAGAGNRSYDAEMFSMEARSGVGLYFEKEVYSAFANPNAVDLIARLVDDLGGADNVMFQVFGYCTGGFCVDAFALGLAKHGYRVAVVLDATAAIDTPDNGMAGAAHSRETLSAAGVQILTTREAMAAAE